MWKSTHKIEYQIGEQVFRTFSYHVHASAFATETIISNNGSGAGTGIKTWFSGGASAENYIEIPLTEMNNVTSVFAQAKVVGGKPFPVTVSIQTYEIVGDNLVVNFDVTEFVPITQSSAAYAIDIDFLVLGTR